MEFGDHLYVNMYLLHTSGANHTSSDLYGISLNWLVAPVLKVTIFHMRAKVGFLGCSIRAHRALERFLSSVDEYVVSTVTLAIKVFAAEWAPVNATW